MINSSNREAPCYLSILINIDINIFPVINHPINQDIEADVIPISRQPIRLEFECIQLRLIAIGIQVNIKLKECCLPIVNTRQITGRIRLDRNHLTKTNLTDVHGITGPAANKPFLFHCVARRGRDPPKRSIPRHRASAWSSKPSGLIQQYRRLTDRLQAGLDLWDV